MPANYVLLERIELNASAASVTFSNIPQSGYTDLKLVMSTRAADSANNWYLTKIQFNTDTTSGNYSARFVGGFGSSAYSSTSSNYAGYIPSGARTANTFGNNEIYIPNYTGSTAKSFSTDSVTEGNGTSYEILGLWAGLWSGTAEINQIVLSPDTGSWAQYSTFSLYGLAAVGTEPVIAPKATGGNIVANDGTYWYHAFLSTGAFVPSTSLTCDALVIAGGGGGGGGGTNFGGGGGGGAGGLLGFASQTISTSTTVTVGAGGAGGTSAGTTGTVGVDSQLGALTLVKGGGYGATYLSPYTGGNGGSGGGASQNGSGGAATLGQGNAGSSGTGSGSYWGGAGGGAGSAATNASGSTAPSAGAGTNTNATYGSFAATVSATNTGVSGYFAGGGGGGNGIGATGGTGGSGGGGNAGVSGGADGSPGVTNTGSGGGGCSISSPGKNGGNGGSGIVIIRYPIA
jgi:hypothetical protein